MAARKSKRSAPRSLSKVMKSLEERIETNPVSAPDPSSVPNPAPPAPDRPVPKPKRKVGWRWRSAEGAFRIIEITQDGVTTPYFLRRVSEKDFLVEKLVYRASVVYTVHLSASTHFPSACGCKAREKDGKTCKHIDAVKALLLQDARGA